MTERQSEENSTGVPYFGSVVRLSFTRHVKHLRELDVRVFDGGLGAASTCDDEEQLFDPIQRRDVETDQ